METEVPETDPVGRALERVLSSVGFARNERQSQFLRFLVEKELDGRHRELKESVIAVEVFGRKADYDPKLDGIVRTEALRLRARLEKYYGSEGSKDALIIEVPKGGYRPVFRPRPAVSQPPALSATMAGDQGAVARPMAKPQAGWTWWTAVGLAAIAVVAGGATWAWLARSSTGTFTVAVLPLENLGQPPTDDYFADGLTDEIIRNLSVIDGLTVRSRTSSFALKEKRVNAAEAGKQLGADYLVAGSVLHAGNQLRVNAVLIRVRDDFPVWSGRFDRQLTDVFAIQDEISRGIVNGLRLKLNSGRRRYDTNMEAYDRYLRGRHAMEGFPSVGRQTALRAVAYYEQAIEKDANYAIAYAGVADALLAIDRNLVNSDAYTRARTAAERAVKLDPMLSEAQSALASVHAHDYAWQDAERGFRRAIELNPNNALAHLELGVSVLLAQGRVEEGLSEARRAVLLDPLSPYANTEYGRGLVMAARYQEGVDQLRKAIATDPSRTRPYNAMGRALYLQGRIAEALTVFNDSLARGAARPAWLACAYVRGERHDEALALLQQDLGRAAPARRLAETYACLGDDEQALDHLERAHAQHEPGLAELLQAPELARLLSNPRFSVLRQKLNLPVVAAFRS